MERSTRSRPGETRDHVTARQKTLKAGLGFDGARYRHHSEHGHMLGRMCWKAREARFCLSPVAGVASFEAQAAAAAVGGTATGWRTKDNPLHLDLAVDILRV